ncbi:hypothetical protein CC85DRAFT_289576 [Cutaneotrichosporon oleaginosum]|uniref:CNH domain-containing protein n=1 Tax=Cutaneotrichosporon oleaginosum TaxID=879819 RepID=A0A0J0XBC7_9TREE|nr:uncharacterized protein CC85DRAFT_289576 [Cutaneotrichosporon oleaginosum]KLT38373.1 hypothetical protein CC85DRAFT_289576 [Cutaneotrichosporon oleaginosum]TXT07051.1 hypothetical protein COLE_06382 [Cutaneotrichosporon oleaginosum]
MDDPYILQPVLADLYDSRDLLDFSAPGTHHITTFSPTASPPKDNAVGSLFSSVAGFAAGVGARAGIASPPQGQGSGSPGSPGASTSPRRGSGSDTEAPERPEVRCVEGFGANLYVGGSDGVVEWWVYDGSAGPSENRGWKLQRKHKLFPCRPVNRVVLLPKVSRALILSEGTLHSLSLPGLEPLPSSSIAPVRGVVSVVLNDDELDLADKDGVTDMTVVLVKRKGLGIYRLGQRMTMVKEIPLPAPPKYHALFSTYMCAALPSESGLTYCIIDLSDASLTEVLPVSQTDPDDSWAPNPNVVVIPGENQFLVTSYTGANTMGVFLNGQGDPERGTIEWEEHPLSIAVESGFIIALLRNHTVVVHSLNDLENPAQTISLDPAAGVFALSYSPYGISIRDVVRDERMVHTRFTLLSGALAPPISPVESPELPVEVSTASEADPAPDIEEPAGGSGLTPPTSPKFARQPITPVRSSSLLSASSARRPPFSSVIAETLVVGRHSIQGLVPTPVVLRLERLCEEHRVDEAIALVDEERRRGRRGEIDVDKATHSATIRFMHQYLACHLLVETVFERAGDYFMRGKVDPRVLVRLFPAYRGKTIGTAEEVDVYEGLVPILEGMRPVEDIISSFLDRNSPRPDPSEAEELRLALYYSAKNMLTEFLRKTRAQRRKGGSRGLDSRKIDIVVDTTLAKLLAEEGTTHELLALLGGPNDVVLLELEPFLAQRKYVLSTVMKSQGRIDRVLELLKEIAEGPPDALCDDPVGELVQTLDTVDDPDLLRHYVLWLVTREPEKALSLLITKGSAIKVDDEALITDLGAVDKDAAHQYLEYVVVGKRAGSPALHEQLLAHLLEQAEEMVADDGIRYHLEELDAEFRLAGSTSYAEFFAEVAPPTPFKIMRLKLMLFLQNAEYDLAAASERLERISVLVTERAIVLGRLNRHTEALRLLAQDLPDTVSAQTYCTLGGEIIPPKVAKAITKHEPGLAGWVAMSEGGKTDNVDAGTQHRLIVELLRAYMRDSSGSARSASLLSAQGVHLDVDEVLDMAPGDWPLDAVTTFYRRSYRRLLQEKTTGLILKSIAAGQNLETSERYLDAISHLPPTTLHPADDAEKSIIYDEKHDISEKTPVESDGSDGTEEKLRAQESYPAARLSRM